MIEPTLIRTKQVAPSWLEAACFDPNVLNKSFFEKHANWIGPLAGQVPSVNLVEGVNLSITNISHITNAQNEIIIDHRIMPRHLCKYLEENRASIIEQTRRLTKTAVEEPVFYFASTKNVFGHWLLEMLPSIIVYKYVYSKSGIKLVLWDETWNKYLNFVINFIGIPEDNILLVPFANTLITFHKIYTMELFHDDYLFNGTFHNIIACVISMALTLPGAPIDTPLRLFVSRSKFQKKTWRPARDTNIEDLESLMRDQYNFRIIHPEELSIHEQINLFTHASHICGLAGSGLHNSIFMAPGTNVISIGFNRVQLKLCIMKRQNIKFILPEGSSTTDASGIERFDLQEISKRLIEIL